MPAQKDAWDKADIISKFLIPIIIAGSVWLWNHEKTKTETAARMTEIAISILSSEKTLGDDPDPIRRWAVDVLRSPGSPPPISLEAAAQLSADPELLRMVDLRTVMNSLVENQLMKYVLEDMRQSPDERLEITPTPTPKNE